SCSTAPLHSELENSRFCKPVQACWPSSGEWQSLGKSITGKLLVPEGPLKACEANPKSSDCVNALTLAKNPFFLTDHAGATLSTGWLGAWKASLSAYAVEAENAADVMAAVNFAREHKLRLVIRGTGHDWQGRSNAPDSLLVWTHKMRKITFHQHFLPQACNKDQSVEKAFTVEAGGRWLDTYKEIMVKHQRYVQGGGCTTVGAVGGFLQGGGFSAWSKKFGSSAANLLEAEVVTADGRIVIANACQNQDLFWALRGGGGGTWGVVTKATMRTHPKPVAVGWIFGSVKAKTDNDYKMALLQLVRFYREHLNNEYWGDGFTLDADNSISISMTFQGMPVAGAVKIFAPFFEWAKGQPERFTVTSGAFEIPGAYMWDPAWVSKHMPARLKFDNRAGEPGDNFWGAGSEASQTSNYWYTYQSRWIPISLFQKENEASFVDTLFAASRQWTLFYAFGKGFSGASDFAINSARETSMNPSVLNAAGLVIGYAAEEFHTDGTQPDPAKGEIQKKKVTSAMDFLRRATPGAGTYFNQADYFEADWGNQFWGENYSKLLAIKKKYDPENFFTCHHCVGNK
ncbi:MAG: FAD-dependent oxidoreductase, partial [Bdellovibrionota bacterium]